MPKRKDLKKILIIGSGPIIIGQACEFDYSGTQACKALRQEGFEVVLVNSNPATIMTDPDTAERTYIEPITPEVVEQVIELERPQALLPTLGGQTALNVAVALSKSGVLEQYNVELIGAKLKAIEKAEDRIRFGEAMEKIGLSMPKSQPAYSVDEAVQIAREIGYPIVVRPAYTLAGTGGGIAYNIEELRKISASGIDASLIGQVLIEESVIGWKEYELEVMRDLKDNVVIICSIENFDPMGIHTGDSITVAPAQTLSDKEYQTMRDAAIAVIREIGVETGGSNIQFAVNPKDGRMTVIEMNPRVSRSSALASKATGFPIAKIAAKLAIGLTLDEIPNDITRETPASFEPTIDYVVVKFPRWTFEKFPQASRVLTTRMKSVGEAMAIGRTFKEALQKAIRSIEIGRFGLAGHKDNPQILGEDAFRRALTIPDSGRIFSIYQALEAGVPLDKIHRWTQIDPWFLFQLKQIHNLETELSDYTAATIPTELLRKAKETGFSDQTLSQMFSTSESTIRTLRKKENICATFKMVDTCAAEFEAVTPYYYSTYESEDEVKSSNKKKVMILGSGPNRIGQGIEFDYACVHAAFALREEGFETIMVNSNPETVSTDYDTSDRLYFEPLTVEDVLNIYEKEKPIGLIVQFGGQTPLNLAKELEKNGVHILGTSPESIDVAEDRERFKAILEKHSIPQPESGIARSFEDALSVAKEIGYPLMVRPSYVLGGRAMEVVYDEDALRSYVQNAVEISPLHPILIDRFLERAIEIEVDAICDGEEVFIGGIMEHIEEAGVHSGDSACVLPPHSLSEDAIATIRTYTHALAKALDVIGLINIQYALLNETVWQSEIRNPKSEIASAHVSVKEAVFPFSKFPEADPVLGPEMRATGEVMGIADTFGLAFYKAQEAANSHLPVEGCVLITVADKDHPAVLEAAGKFMELGFELVATGGTHDFLGEHGIPSRRILKLNEGRPNIVDAIKNGKIHLVINTPLGKSGAHDDSYIRQTAIRYGVPYITTTAAATAAATGIAAAKGNASPVRAIQDYHARIGSSGALSLMQNA
ncbi:MAG: carbamoyl phosphate synthase large subunit [Candidatus Latescibacteria bacterium 4484_107]|nr:MAG: carbamoyl phosphate synthase large subunit [Candidatus Latescibacteria bacterium 4484_107]